MPDVFDELETPQGDIFDEIEAPSDSISGRALGTEMTARSAEPPVMKDTDPMFPAAREATTIARIGLENFLLPTRVDAFDILEQQDRARRVAEADVAAQRAEERLGPLKANPNLLLTPEGSAMATAANRLRERATALNERYQAGTALGQMRAEEAATAQREVERRKAFEASGEGPGVVGTFLEQIAGMAANTLGGVARTLAPSIGGAPGDALIRQGAEITELANVNQTLGGKVARGAGTVAGLLAGNPAGALPATAAVGLKGAMDAYSQTLAQTGNSSEANRAAASTFPALALYMATGIAGARGAAALVPADASAAQKALAGFAGAGLANVGTTAAMAAAEGTGYGIEQLTADTLLALFHAKGEYSRAKAEARDAAKVELENRGFTEEQLAKPYEVQGETPATVVELPAERAPIPELSEPAQPAPEGGEKTIPAADAPIAETPMGPGAANVAEAGALREIGVYNAKVDEQRAARGLPPLMSEARRSNEATWDAAQARIEANPQLPDIITNELLFGARKAVNAEDQGVLAWRMVDLTNKRDLEAERINDPDLDPLARTEAESAFNHYESELQRTEEANRKFGTEWGRTGQFRQRLIRDDFTLGNMQARARAAKGEGLTPAEVAEIKTESERFQTARETLEKIEEGAPVDATVKAIEKNMVPDFAPEVRSLSERLVERLDRAADAALRRLRAKGMAQLGSSPDTSIIADAVIYGTAKITKGLVKSGQWAASMVKDLGEWVRPHLADIWKKANEEIDGQVTRATAPRNRSAVKDAVTKVKAVATADDIGAKMKARATGGEKLADMRGDVAKLVETLVRGGIKQRDPLVDAVHGVLQTIDPVITRRQAMDAISGYGDFKPLSKDAIKAEVRDLKGQLQQVAKMEDILAGEPLKKTGVERKVPSDEERSLIKQVNELARQKGVKVTDPAVQLKTVLGAIETRLTNRIKDLKLEIEKGQRAVKTRTPSPSNPKIEALRAELAAVEEQHQAVFGKQTKPMTDEQKLRAYKARAKNRIAELEERIAKGDFEKRGKRPPLDLSKDPQAVAAKAEMERVKKEFETKQFQREQAKRSRLKKTWDAIKETLAATRSAITSLDVSAPFRQGGFLLIGDLVTRPTRAARQIGSMFRQLASEKAFEDAQAKINLRPNARNGLYQSSKLYFSDMDSKISAREESMRSNLLEKIPYLRRLYRPANRAYTGFLNRQRADSFDAMVEAMGGKDVVTPEQAQTIADFVNTATGRGTVLGFEQSANALARYFFSPRFLASRFQLATGQPLVAGMLRGGKNAPAMRQIAQQYGKFALGLAAIYGLATLAGGKVEKDPRSADFGKIKVGSTRIDPMAGLAQVTTFLSRMVTGKTKQDGAIKPKKRSDTFTRFGRTKLAPIPGVLADYAAERTLDNQKPTALGSLQRLTVPLAYQEVPGLVREHGPAKGIALQILNLLGFGIQSYR